MTNEDENKILKQALTVYGVNLQVTTAMEELAELISELNRYFFRESRREGISILDKKYALASEIADVEIVCKTLRILIGDGIVEGKVHEKMVRLNERTNSEVRTILRKEINMTFDQNPADDYEHYQCERCGGSIRLSADKSLWECDTCDFQVRNKKEGE